MNENACPRCGAPLPIASFGAAVQCKFCDDFAPPPFNTDPVELKGGATGEELMAALRHGTGVRITKDPHQAAALRAAIARMAPIAQGDEAETRAHLRIFLGFIGMITLIAIIAAVWGALNAH